MNISNIMFEEHPTDVKTHACHQREDGQLIFGEVVQFQNDPERIRTQWDDNPVDEQLDLFVYDKQFSEGQHVRRNSDGVIGRIIRVNCLVSVSVNLDGAKRFLTDIPIDRIQPISNTYPGAHVRCNGCIGTVEEVKQEWCVKFQGADNVTCRKSLALLPVREKEQGQPPFKHTSLIPQPVRVEDNQPCSYPYFKTRRIPVPGQKTTFGFRQLRYANWKGSTSWKWRPFILSWHFKKKEATILSVKVRKNLGGNNVKLRAGYFPRAVALRLQEKFVKVKWQYRYRDVPGEEDPPTVFYKDDCEFLKPRYIFPYEFISDDSLAKIEWLEGDSERLTTEYAWKREFFQSSRRLVLSSTTLAERHTDEHESIPVKRARLDPTITIPEPGAQIPVQINAIRHELKVYWENATRSKIMASDVDKAFGFPEPVLQKEKYLVIKPCIFREDSDGHYFGVNLGPHGENMIDVLWVRKVQCGADGEQTSTSENQTHEVDNQKYKLVPRVVKRESIFDVALQHDFCKFQLGNLVFPSEFCTNPNFDLGIIQQIKHNGRMVVRDGNKTPALQFWPCEIQTKTTGQRIEAITLKPLAYILQSLLGSQVTPTALATRDLNKLAPDSHHFFSDRSFRELSAWHQRKFRFQVFKDYMMLYNAQPDGVWLRGYDNRYDLHSLLIIGPPGTPFEGMIFTFDVYLPSKYPCDPPEMRLNQMSDILLSPYITPEGFVNFELLNPPLIEPLGSSDGSVGDLKGIHSLCSVISALYEAIFTPHPMEPADTIFDPENKAQAAQIALRNQFTCLSSLEVCIQALSNPPEPWREYILGYYAETLPIIAETVSSWVDDDAPFPLHPLTEGFTVSVNRRLDILRQLSDEVATNLSSVEN